MDLKQSTKNFPVDLPAVRFTSETDHCQVISLKCSLLINNHGAIPYFGHAYVEGSYFLFDMYSTCSVLLLKISRVSIFLLYVTFGDGFDWLGKEVHCSARHSRAS